LKSLAFAGLLAGCGFSFAPVARANLIINPTFSFDTSLTTAQQQQFQAGFQAAINEFQDMFADNVTLNVTFATQSGTAIFGRSNYTVHNTYSYAQLTAALQSHATTPADATALANLGADPTHGGNFVVNDANAKVLGLRSATDPSSDGMVTIGSGYSFSFDPSNRAVAGKYDFIGIVEHELSEVMGRAQGLGASFGSGPYASVYEPFDLFRYTSAGSHSITGGVSNVYFSIDGGTTPLKYFNSNPTEDYSDWVTNGPDSANAFSNSGVVNAFGSVDQTAMDVMGYTPAPEPSGAVALLSLSAAALAGRRRRRAAVTE
jgi:hypothetical protein